MNITEEKETKVILENFVSGKVEEDIMTEQFIKKIMQKIRKLRSSKKPRKSKSTEILKKLGLRK